MILSHRWRHADRWIQERFRMNGEFASKELPTFRHEALAGYFVLGFLHYRLPHGSMARYPGAPSANGTHCDRMEGFSRIAPLLGAWLAGGRGETIPLPGRSEPARPLDLLRDGIRAGTDPGVPWYWGEIRDRRQQLVEAADIALATWLARDELWPALGAVGRERLIAWLREGIDREVVDNNWHLFPVIIWAVLRSFGVTELPDLSAKAHYARFKEFHLGEGWFRDGPGGHVDYYNAWQMHYALFWIGEILPGFDRAFREEVAERFLESYRLLIGPAGFPILGRSVCYRMGAPAPLVAGSFSGRVPPGEARRSLDRTWGHFIARGAVGRGLVTQGYGRADTRFLDAYSGPASPLWSLRSLVVAFTATRDSAFWTGPDVPLPVERGSYERAIPPVGWRIRGDRETGEVVIHRGQGLEPGSTPIRPHPGWRRAVDRVRRRPSRPENHEAKFGLQRYSALEPFCGYGPGSIRPGRAPRVPPSTPA